MTVSEDKGDIVQRSDADSIVAIGEVIQAEQQLCGMQEAYTDSLRAFFQAHTELETSLASNPFLQRNPK